MIGSYHHYHGRGAWRKVLAAKPGEMSQAIVELGGRGFVTSTNGDKDTAVNFKSEDPGCDQ